MQEISDIAGIQENVPVDGASPAANPDADGRNKEWQDRARVNLEETPEGVHTNIERDFEPENLEDESQATKKEHPPAY